MEIIRNHSISENIGQTELSNEYWRLKELKRQPQVLFYILKRCRPTSKRPYKPKNCSVDTKTNLNL